KERPPFGDLALAPLLEAQVEIAVATGDLDTARRGAEALGAIAGTYTSPWLVASAALAEARVALLAGDLDAAAASSASAAAAWADLGAPYEAAVARSVLADAHGRAGRLASARLERQAAAAAFEAFGAVGQADRARALLADAPPDDAPSAPTTATFRLDGTVRTIAFAGTSASMRDLKGFRYLARLLADPGREVHVLDLVAVERGTLPTGRPGVVDPGQSGFGTSGDGALPALDEQARQAYQRRLADVDEDIEDARRDNDPARAELAQRDRDYLIAELSRAVGLGGRLRAVGGDAERARMAVAHTLRYAVDRLAEQLPALATHLTGSVHTGTYCCYRPDPLSNVVWSS
ncbi:MAG TPA: hypothetical protein VHK88_04270, partial [Aquihabitans sp.]|nr:hypothetical protein [Aquihabitans sp.]